MTCSWPGSRFPGAELGVETGSKFLLANNPNSNHLSHPVENATRCRNARPVIEFSLNKVPTGFRTLGIFWRPSPHRHITGAAFATAGERIPPLLEMSCWYALNSGNQYLEEDGAKRWRVPTWE